MRTTLAVACSLVVPALPGSASAVVGGTAVKPGTYPSVVAVGTSESMDCGGTLIAPDVVLTAAHCIAGATSTPDSLRVLAGSTSLTAGLAAANATHLLRVAAVYTHPKFNPQSMHYDAALLILTRPVTGLPTLPMATLTTRSGAAVSAAGWGRTSEHGATSPNHLRSVALEVETPSTCRTGNAVLGEYFAPSMMCASAPGRDTCAGDSGGPLIGTSGGHTALVGITSYGDGCGEPGHPGVYTRVAAISGWARALLAQLRKADHRGEPSARAAA
jgi:trypsin